MSSAYRTQVIGSESYLCTLLYVLCPICIRIAHKVEVTYESQAWKYGDRKQMIEKNGRLS